MYYLAFLRGDSAHMEQQLSWGAGKPGAEDPLLSAQSDTDAYYGRLTKARDFTRRAVGSAIRADSKETAALWQVNAALREAEFGSAAAAKQDVAAALALAPGRDVKVLGALALARGGDTARAKAMIEELEKSDPTNTVLQVLVESGIVGFAFVVWFITCVHRTELKNLRIGIKFGEVPFSCLRSSAALAYWFTAPSISISKFRPMLLSFLSSARWLPACPRRRSGRRRVLSRCLSGEFLREPNTKPPPDLARPFKLN